MLFGLKFVASEFLLKGFRLDSLAFDEESKAFVIIEYKNTSNYSVIDQGYAYLSLLLNNKAEFVLAYNERLGEKQLKMNEVDWSQSRVIFVSPTFSTYQRSAINFKNLPFELYEARKYENNIIEFDKVSTEGASESISSLSKAPATSNVSREIKVYSEEDHYKGGSDNTNELYEALKERVLSLGQVKIEPKKFYIAFKTKTNFFDVEVQKKQLKCHINVKKGELEDPKNIARDVTKIGHYGNGDYEVAIEKQEELDYLMTLVRQSYKKISA